MYRALYVVYVSMRTRTHAHEYLTRRMEHGARGEGGDERRRAESSRAERKHADGIAGRAAAHELLGATRSYMSEAGCEGGSLEER